MKSTALFAIVSLLAIIVASVAGEPPRDTVLARYLVFSADTAAYRSELQHDGSRVVAIIVPFGARPGDTLLGARVWPENMPAYRGLQGKLNETEMALKQRTTDIEALTRELDSLLRAKGEIDSSEWQK